METVVSSNVTNQTDIAINKPPEHGKRDTCRVNVKAVERSGLLFVTRMEEQGWQVMKSECCDWAEQFYL